MVQIFLPIDEAELLKEILKDYLSDLRMEIADTDSMNFREELKKKEEFVKRIITDLGLGD
jgi:hypothetical protein